MPNVRKRRNTVDARREYIETRISLNKLSQKYKGIKGCSHKNLLALSAKNKWKSKREKYRAKLEEKIEEKTIEKVSEQIAYDRAQLVEENVTVLEDLKKLVLQKIKDKEVKLDFANLRQAITSMRDIVNLENILLQSTFQPGETDATVTELQINITRKTKDGPKKKKK